MAYSDLKLWTYLIWPNTTSRYSENDAVFRYTGIFSYIKNIFKWYSWQPKLIDKHCLLLPLSDLRSIQRGPNNFLTKLNTGLIWSHIHSLLLLDTTSITMIYEVVNKNKTIAIFQIKPQIFHTESINTKKEMWVMWKGKYSMVKAVSVTCVFAMLLYLFSNCVIIAYKIDTFKSKVSTLNIFASKTFL